MRAFLRETFTDAAGTVEPNKALTFYESDGTTPIATTIYAAATGSTAATLQTDTNGEFVGYSNVAKPVQIAVSGRSSKALSAFVADLSRRAVSVQDFGATGDGVTDDTSAFQAALDYADTNGLATFVAKGSYLVTGLTAAARQVILGEDVNRTKIILSSGVADTVDAIRVVAGSSESNARFGKIAGLQVQSQSASNGRHGIAFDSSVQDSYIGNYTIERCWLYGSYSSTTTGQAIGHVKDTTGTPVTYPLSQLRVIGCLLYGGCYLDTVADSIWWQHNHSGGPNVGIRISTTTGAAGTVIRDSTFVNYGGGIWATKLLSASVENNYFEQQLAWAGGSGNNALIDLDCAASGDVESMRIDGNQFSLTTAAGTCIRIKRARGTIVKTNLFYMAVGGSYGVDLVTAGFGTVFHRDNKLQNGSAGTLLSSNSNLDGSFAYVPLAYDVPGGATGDGGNLYLTGLVRAGRFAETLGGAIASASTIVLDSLAAGGGGNTFHVTGTTTINTITGRGTGDVVTLIADGAWALGNAGNVKAAAAAMTVDRGVRLVWDAATSFWYECGRGS